MATAELVQRLPLLFLLHLSLFLILCLFLVHNGCKADTSTGFPDCPHAGVWETSVEKCFIVVESDHGESGYESVYEAARKCRSFGAVIASVETEAVKKTVAKLIVSSLHRHVRQVYIGLNDIKAENNFTWFDGSQHHPRIDTWDIGEPNAGNYKHDEDCVVMRLSNGNTRSHWHDYPCCTRASIKAVLCQIDRHQLEEEKSETSSDTKMRFPEVELLAKTCLKNFSHCSSVECLNGGSCVDREDNYECVCPLGYSGSLCENDVDECLEATCLNNATCVDSVGEFQCVCGEDFVGPSCETAICPELIVIGNSEREGNLREEGSTVSYTCNPGFAFPTELRGRTRIELVCSQHKWTIVVQENDANYSLDLLQCRPVCEEPFSFNDSRKTGESFYEGSTVNYTCNPMFDLAEEFKGQKVVEFICSDHKWKLVGEVGSDQDTLMEPDSVSCQPVCPPLTIANSSWTGDDVSDGSTVRYTCDPGFQFFPISSGLDVLELKCIKHNWTVVIVQSEKKNTESYCENCQLPFDPAEREKTVIPQCQAVCPPLTIANSSRTSDDVSEGSTVRYTCDPGFRFFPILSGQDVLELKCIKHNWTVVIVQSEEENMESYDYDNCRRSSETVELEKPDIPQCQAILCPQFPSWRGIRTENTSRMVNAVIWYTCAERKEFVVDVGRPYLTSKCHENQSWFPNFQRCKYSENELVPKIEPKEARGAVAIGTVAIVFLSLELALVVLMDIDHLIRHAKMLKDNVVSGFRRLIGAK